jgi:hypothetical protein
MAVDMELVLLPGIEQAGAGVPRCTGLRLEKEMLRDHHEHLEKEMRREHQCLPKPPRTVVVLAIESLLLLAEEQPAEVTAAKP